MNVDIRFFLGLILFLGIHEMGHALTASVFGRYITYVIHNGNPGVKHWIHVGDKKTSKNKLHVIISSGFFFNIITMSLIQPLMADTGLIYVILCTAISLLDFNIMYKIYKKNRKAEK